MVNPEMCNSYGWLFDEDTMSRCLICSEWTCGQNDWCECTCTVELTDAVAALLDSGEADDVPEALQMIERNPKLMPTIEEHDQEDRSDA